MTGGMLFLHCLLAFSSFHTVRPFLSSLSQLLGDEDRVGACGYFLSLTTLFGLGEVLQNHEGVGGIEG